MNDMRYMMDGRRLPPRNSRGEFMSRGRGRGRRRDRGMMDYADMRGDMRMRDYEMDMRRGDGRVIRSYPDRGGDYRYDMAREDMRSMDYRGGDYRSGQMSDYGTMRMGDGHHYPEHQMGGGQTYYPIEAMGRFNGYWGMPQGDYGYGDMRGRRDYGYDYSYRDYGDYGETLSEKEIDEWCHKLMSQLDEREKQIFHKDTIMQKARSMNKPMEGFGEKELYVATLMVYTDYKDSIGQNPDLAVKLAYDWLSDKDVAVKGANKLATYYDCIVEGDDD